MTKTELIEAIVKETKATKATAEKHLSVTLGAIQKAIRKGDSVNLIGFGSFSVVTRKARNGRNPQTGKPLKIPATKVAKFTPGKGLKEAAKRK